VTDYYKFHYGGEAQKIAMNNDLNDTTDHKISEIKISKNFQKLESTRKLLRYSRTITEKPAQ
jgi:hypothetical protein